jgi:hypothetical protein
MYASEEDRAVMEKTLKEQPERPRIDGTMRSDHSSLKQVLHEENDRKLLKPPL